MGFNMQNLPPLAIYVHLPWCIRKCPYCDFNSYKIPADCNATDIYCNALIKTIYNELNCLNKKFNTYHNQANYKDILNREIISIYIGGGTPSLFNPHQINKIISTLRSCFKFHKNIEISMEANPGTLDFEKLSMYKEAGLNRISIGVQSLNNKHLKTLNRIHSRDKALETISNVNKIFTNFNVDLMHSLPNQSSEEAILDLKDVLSITPPHLSWYQLTIEEGTPFEKNTPLLPDDNIVENIYLEGYELLKKYGYNHYEVSAFARSGFKCIHNSNYWRFGDYLSFGAGAHSKLTIINNLNKDNNKVIVRTHNEDTPNKFIELVNSNQPYYEVQTVNKDELPFEYFLNRLRLFEDFDLNEFTKYTSLDKQIALNKLENAINNGLITISSNNIVSITNKGHLFVNSILEDFL